MLQFSNLNSLRNICFGILGLVFLISCDKDAEDNDGNTSTIIVPNIIGSSTIIAPNIIDSSIEISTVKFGVWVHNSTTPITDFDIIAQSPYKNNSFTLTLPYNISAKYLHPITDTYLNAFTISEGSAKIFDFGFIVTFDKNEKWIGYAGLANEDRNSSIAWIYVDKNVTIKGEEYIDSRYSFLGDSNYDRGFEEYREVDLNFKEGWNVYYYTVQHIDNPHSNINTFIVKITSQKPSNIKYYWYFSDQNGSGR
jgi:hypothetical protein